MYLKLTPKSTAETFFAFSRWGKGVIAVAIGAQRVQGTKFQGIAYEKTFNGCSSRVAASGLVKKKTLAN